MFQDINMITKKTKELRRRVLLSRRYPATAPEIPIPIKANEIKLFLWSISGRREKITVTTIVNKISLGPWKKPKK